jgi:hypothetical protein
MRRRVTIDSISKLRSLTTEARVRDEQLRANFEELDRQLREAASGYSIRGKSKNTFLETYGDGDSYYGHLFFSDRLAVAYRTSEDDMEISRSKEHFEPTYSVESVDNCSPYGYANLLHRESSSRS